MQGEQRIIEQLAAIHEKIESIESDLTNVIHLLTGNGTPERGILVRLDRIEQANDRRGFWVKATLGSVIAAIVGLVAAAVKAWGK